MNLNESESDQQHILALIFGYFATKAGQKTNEQIDSDKQGLQPIKQAFSFGCWLSKRTP